METPNGPARPRQVTLAAWLIMLGSAFVVLAMFERVAGLHTLETQETVQTFLSEPPGDSLGLGLQTVQSLLHTMAMVAAGCATAASILGFQVLQRSRSARVLLSILAVPLFLSGLLSGGFLSSVVAAAIVMLWFQPSRDWFDGVTREARPAPAPAPTVPAGPTGETGATGASVAGGAGRPAPGSAPTQPPAFPGFGSPPDTGATSAQDTRVWAMLGGQTPAPETGPRPAAVTRAVVTTWVFATLAVLVMGASIVVVASDPALVFDQLRQTNPELADQGISESLIVRLVYLFGGLTIAWSLAAIAFAALVLRRVGWARPALVVSASISAVFSLMGLLDSVLLMIPLLAAVATVWWLTRPEVRDWFRRG